MKKLERTLGGKKRHSPARVDKLFEWKILYEKYEKNVGNGNVNCVGATCAGRGGEGQGGVKVRARLKRRPKMKCGKKQAESQIRKAKPVSVCVCDGVLNTLFAWAIEVVEAAGVRRGGLEGMVGARQIVAKPNLIVK